MKTTPTRWMIVDDSKDILTLMSAIVGRLSNAEVECFDSPQTALAAFTAAPDRFQFVITDLQMPGMNGIELSRRLLEVSPSLKILLATGSGIVSEEAATRMGFCGLLQKPFTLSALQSVLEAADVSGRKDFQKHFAKSAVLTMT